MILSLHRFTRMRLIQLRWLSVAGMLMAAWISPYLLDTQSLVLTLSLYATAVATLNLAATVAFRLGQDPSPLQQVLSPMVQLSADVLLWGGYVYLCGGASNPLISVLLPLVAIGAVVLSQRQAWALGAGAIVLYSILWKFHVSPAMDMVGDGAMHHVHQHEPSSSHVVGMWIVFVVSAVVLLWFILRMSQEIRERDAALLQAKERALRNDWLVSLGSLAASAAHTMSTPLATLHLLLDEWLERHQQLPSEMQEDLRLMSLQVDVCKEALSHLTHRAGQPRGSESHTTTAGAWLQPLLDGWTSLHPQCTVELTGPAGLQIQSLEFDLALERALTNLLDNALHANATHIRVQVDAQPTGWNLHIDDDGHGIGEHALQAFAQGQPAESGQGMGIGLLLTRSTVEHLGGTLTLHRLPQGGSRATLWLPHATTRSQA